MKKINIPTLIAISILSWIMVNMFHEILGHAVVGVISGLKLKAVNTTTAYLDVNWDNEINQNGFSRFRLVLFGGVLINFITGLIAWLVLEYKKLSNSQMRLFLWLFASFSYIIVVMNLVTAPLLGGGDLAGIIKTFEKPDHTRIIVLIVGLLIMIFGFMFLQKSFLQKNRMDRPILLSITIIPIFTVIIIQTLSILKSPFAYLPPSQNHLLASVFAYFHFLLWALIVYLVTSSRKAKSIKVLKLGRSITWIIIALILSLCYILILGPGIGSFEGLQS